ncbi:MAG: hypothetical protein ACAI25_18155, partial [Planctomycetota bacterium]
ADVFALGLVIYECLSGRPAFAEGSALGVAAKLELHDYVPLRKASPKTSRWLVEVVERAMAHDPAARYPDGTELARALTTGPSNEPGSGAWKALVAGGLVVAIAGGVALGWRLTSKPAPSPPAPPPAPVVPAQPPAPPPPPASGAALPELFRSLHETRAARLTAVLGGTEWKAGHPVWRVVLAPDGGTAFVAGEKTFLCIEVATGRVLWNVANAHGPSVHGVGVSADGKLVATGGADKLVKLWELRGAQPPVELRRFEGHEGLVQSVRFSPDGRKLLTSGDDATARLWEVATGRLLGVLKGHASVVAAAEFLPGDRAVTASFDKTLKTWDLATGAALRTLEGHEDVVTSVAVLKGGARALSTSQDWTLVLWDLDKGTALQKRRVHDGFPYGLGLSPDGKRVITAGNESLVKVWEVSDFSEVKTLAGHVHWTPACAFLPDGKRALSACFDRTIRLWDIERGLETSTTAGHRGEVTAVALSPDGQFVATGGADSTLRLWEAKRGQELRCLEEQGGRVASVRFAEGGERIVAASADGKVRIVGLDDAIAPRTIVAGGSARALEGHTGEVLALAVSGTGKRIVSGGADGTARIWDTSTARTLHTLKGHGGPVIAVDYARDGKLVVTAGEDRKVHLWETNHGKAVKTLAELPARITAVAISPRSDLVLAADESGLVVLYAATGEELDRIDLEAACGAIPLSLAFSGDGRSFAVGTSRGVALRFELR